MTKKLKNQTIAVNTFVGQAIESNLLDTAKTVIDAFPHDVNFSSHEISISLYSVYRGENAEMMDYLFSKGAELESHQISQVIKQSPLPTFKTIFNHYRDWFERRADLGRSPQLQALNENRFDLLPFLKEEGFTLTSDVFPLKECVGRLIRHDSKIQIHAIKNINYTMDDFDALEDETKERFIIEISNASEDFINALVDSDLADIIDTPALQKYVIKNNNAYLLSLILNRNPTINAADINCDATKFLNDAAAFEVAIQCDKEAKYVYSEETPRDYYSNRLIGQILTTSSSNIFRLATQHITRLAKLKTEQPERVCIENILKQAFKYLNDATILQQFFALLPNNTFSGNDMLEQIIIYGISDSEVNDITHFMFAAQNKGAILDKNFFYNVLEYLMRGIHTLYKTDVKTHEHIHQLIRLAASLHGECIYDRIHTLSPYYDKSDKQILASFRQALYSKNKSKNASIIMMLFVAATEDQRIDLLNAMTYTDNLNDDIAFKEVMRVWQYDPITAMSLPINNKIKRNIVTALAA